MIVRGPTGGVNAARLSRSAHLLGDQALDLAEQRVGGGIIAPLVLLWRHLEVRHVSLPLPPDGEQHNQYPSTARGR